MFDHRPGAAAWVFEPFQRAGLDLRAVARSRRSEVPPTLHRDGVDEVFVQVVDEFARTVFQGSADRDVVEDRQVLDVLTESDAAGVRADGHTELRRQQQDGQHLVDATQPAAADLAEVDRLRLHQLLEHHAVLDVLAGRDAARLYRFADAAVAQHVVRAGRLLDPPRVDLGQHAYGVDRLVDAPHLVRVEHQLAFRSDGLAQEASTAQI